MKRKLGQDVPRPTGRRTNRVLKLNLQAVRDGRTWELLPEAFRGINYGDTYPLPNDLKSLEALAELKIPTQKVDSGCKYLRRARLAYYEKRSKREDSIKNIERTEHSAKEKLKSFHKRMDYYEKKAKAAVIGVQKEAESASASLKELFSLGKRGLKAQMEAHISGDEWQGEKISAAAFRDCYGKVAQTVKNFGLPTENVNQAAETIFQELADQIRDTQDAVDLAPSNSETEQ